MFAIFQLLSLIWHLDSYPRSDAMEEWRDVDLGDTASYSESERYKKDSRREWWLEITNPGFPDPDELGSKGLRPDEPSYLQRNNFCIKLKFFGTFGITFS